MDKSLWQLQVEQDPEHSAWYVQRFRDMAVAGQDLDGEMRLVDAMVHRDARILDAGCGPGRVGGALARRGHTVVGVDGDPVLIAAAEEDHPGPVWLVQDLAELDLSSVGITEPFDAIVCAGNVMPFLAPTTRRTVLDNLRAQLAEQGRLITGFGAGRDYAFDEFLADAAAVGLRADVKLSTWDLRPWDEESDFLVAIFSLDR